MLSLLLLLLTRCLLLLLLTGVAAVLDVIVGPAEAATAAAAVGVDAGVGSDDRTYIGTIVLIVQVALQTGQARRDGSGCCCNGFNPSRNRSAGYIPASNHLYKHGQQYKCPHCVTTGSTTASKHILQLNRASKLLLLLLLLPTNDADDVDTFIVVMIISIVLLYYYTLTVDT